MIQYNNFLIKREQSRAGSRFAECEKSRLKAKILMTLALLLTAVTGAWAEETPLVTIYASNDFKSGSQTFDNKVKATFSNEVSFIADNGWCGVTAGDKTLTVEPVDGVTITRVKYYTTLGNAEDIKAPFEASMYYTYIYVSSSSQQRFHVSVNGSMIGAEDTHNYLQKIEVYGTAEPPIEVAWNASTNTGTFTQPGSNVVLTPLYAPTAAWAEVETVKQLPAAAEGVIAGTDAPLIVEGIVAFAGETENPQGTVMYAVTPVTVTDATELRPSDWKNTVPTAKTIADDGAEVKVWYYIQGADTPDGQEATADNTFNNSEVSSLTVTVLSNKFDIQFNAANANTIEAGMATVTVGGTAATVTDGKLEGVKMGSEVKVKANTGYKFRKVEVKKKAPTTTVTWSPVSCYGTYTQDGVTLTPSNGDAVNGNNFYQFGDNTFTTTLGKFIKIEIVFESTTYTFDGWTMGTAEQQYQPDPHTYPDWWKNLLKLTWTGDAESVTIKGKDVFGIHSITFTIQ